jgi:hypothetical protein
MEVTTNVIESFKGAISEIIAIYLYNVCVLKADANVKAFNPPEAIEHRRKITDVIKDRSRRKTVISKPKSATGQSTTQQKRTPRHPKTIPVAPVGGAEYNKFKVVGDVSSKKQMNAAKSAFKNYIGTSDETAKSIISQEKLSQKFNMYAFQIDQDKRVGLCTYAKGTSDFVLAIAMQYSNGNKRYLPAAFGGNDLSENDIKLYRIIKNYTITIPEITFPTASLLKKLLSEIEKQASA